MGTDDEPSTPPIKMPASARWAFGVLFLVALTSSEISNIGTILVLPLAVTAAFLSGLCNADIETFNLTTKTPRKFRENRHLGDFLEYLAIWFDLLTQLSAGATAARIISSTIDYMGNGKTSQWFNGYQSHYLGEPWPDIIAIAIIFTVCVMFMLGLENSLPFFIILNVTTALSLGFFLTVGYSSADLSFWKKITCCPEGTIGLLTAAALTTFTFADIFPTDLPCKSYTTNIKTNFFLVLLLQMISYTALVLCFTLLSYFRELTGTDVPLIQIFEVRDIGWARPFMASMTMVALAVSLMEFFPAMQQIIILLAGNEWKVLVQTLTYEHEITGSPMLAIFTTGILCGILAFACPLSYLIRLLNAGPLIKHICQALAIMYYRYKPEDGLENYSVCNHVEYSRLNQPSNGKLRALSKLTRAQIKRKLLKGSYLLPNSMRKSRTSLTDLALDSKKVYKKKREEESEYLLMSAYSPDQQFCPPSGSNHRSETDLNFVDSDSQDSENDVPTAAVKSSDDESVTDIDAVVQEFRERSRSQNLQSEGQSVAFVRVPTKATSHIVLWCNLGVLCASVTFGLGVLYDDFTVICSSSLGIIIFLIIVSIQPQVMLEQTLNQPLRNLQENFLYYISNRLIPVLPIANVFLNVILAITLMTEIWAGVLLWAIAGMLIFVRCKNCTYCWDFDASEHQCKSDREHILRNSVISLVPNHTCLPHQSMDSFSHVDTILITR